jgi:multidrug efflux pump subunit AcrA (membrane-fusion protein)
MAPGCPEHPPIDGPVRAGFLLIAILLGGFFAWGAMAPLQSAAIAQGSVNLDTHRKTVQHLEGGIIKTISVREGQNVQKDDVLILLDEIQANSKVELLKAKISSQQKRLALINDEIDDIEMLYAKGLSTKSRVLALHRRKAELEGERSESLAQIRAADDVIARSKIRAPMSGTVVGLTVHTPGGIVKPGEALLSIVPKNEQLVVEAQLDPNDIDILHQGQAAQVRLTPFNARVLPLLEGRVVWISADRMSDENTGANYYLARVELTSAASDLPDGVALYPGMPAEVMLLTGERTLISYLTAPLSRSFARAFREK